MIFIWYSQNCVKLIKNCQTQYFEKLDQFEDENYSLGYHNAQNIQSTKKYHEQIALEINQNYRDYIFSKSITNYKIYTIWHVREL